MNRQVTAPCSGDLARRIAHRRDELGLIPEEVARRAAMDVGYLDYFEHNPAAALSSGRWLRLARALETTPASLAGGDVGRPPGPGRAGPHPVLETLTRKQCEDHLVAGGVGRVVFSADRGPVALPVNFRFVDGQVVFRTQPTATPAVTAGAIVSFEVDRIDEAMSEGWSVLLTGRAQRVEDRTELAELALIGIEPWAGGEREAVVRIEIDEISGRAIRQQPEHIKITDNSIIPLKERVVDATYDPVAWLGRRIRRCKPRPVAEQAVASLHPPRSGGQWAPSAKPPDPAPGDRPHP